MDRLHRVGVEVERRWASGRRDHSFATIARDALAGADLPPFDWDEMVDYALTRGNHSRFGDLNDIAFRCPDFYVELIVWGTSSPDIHSHSFAGAFRVVEGSSVHAVYSLTSAVWRSPAVIVGEAQLDDLRILARGDTWPIEPGVGFMHGLYHCQHPSVTAVVRTHGDPVHRIQYGMPPPGPGPQVLTAAREIERHREIRTIDELIAFLPWPRIEAAIVARASAMAPELVWYVANRRASMFSPAARAAIDAVLPDALRGVGSLDRRRPSLLRVERGSLASDRARIAAGLAHFAPDRELALAPLRAAFPEQDPEAFLTASLVEVFASIFRESVDEGLAATIVPAVLRGADFTAVLTAFEDQYSSDSVAEHREHISTAYQAVSNQLARLVASPPA